MNINNSTLQITGGDKYSTTGSANAAFTTMTGTRGNGTNNTNGGPFFLTKQ